MNTQVDENQPENAQETIYIAPGYNSCNVYAMPYPMRPGQSPRDLNERYQSEWVRIGQLDHNLNIRFLDKRYQHLKDEIEGQGPLTHFTVDVLKEDAKADATTGDEDVNSSRPRG